LMFSGLLCGGWFMFTEANLITFCYFCCFTLIFRFIDV
jgi:hypothetical protein